MDTHALFSLLKNAWKGEPSAVLNTNTRVSTGSLLAGDTKVPNGSAKQLEHSGQSSSTALSWISLIARTTSQTQLLLPQPIYFSSLIRDIYLTLLTYFTEPFWVTDNRLVLEKLGRQMTVRKEITI
jgi:hypothetical protein